MSIEIDILNFDIKSTDPLVGDLLEGDLWYNATEQLFKVYKNSTITSLTDAVTFVSHTGSTANPHSTTLEQARTAGATLAGSINMGGNAITNLGAGSLGTDAAQRQWVLDQMSGGGITEPQHEALDTLTHSIAEDSFDEVIYSGNKITNTTTWDSPSKVTKIREEQVTYIGNKIDKIIVIQYNASGVETYRVTETLAYSGNKISSVSRVRVP